MKRLSTGVVLFIVATVIAGWPWLMAGFYRNVGMVNLAQDALTVSPIANADAARWLKLAENTRPNLMTQARINSIQSNFNTESFKCGDAADDYLRTISLPLRASLATPRPLFLLTLETPQSARVERSYFNTPAGCETELAVDFEQAPNRYATLSTRVPVKANTRYRISGFFRTTGNNTAWFGIRRLWPGQTIPSSNTWQKVSFEFVSNTTIEHVQLLITSGKGAIRVRDFLIVQISS